MLCGPCGPQRSRWSCQWELGSDFGSHPDAWYRFQTRPRSRLQNSRAKAKSLCPTSQGGVRFRETTGMHGVPWYLCLWEPLRRTLVAVSCAVGNRPKPKRTPPWGHGPVCLRSAKARPSPMCIDMAETALLPVNILFYLIMFPSLPPIALCSCIGSRVLHA